MTSKRIRILALLLPIVLATASCMTHGEKLEACRAATEEQWELRDRAPDGVDSLETLPCLSEFCVADVDAWMWFESERGDYALCGIDTTFEEVRFFAVYQQGALDQASATCRCLGSSLGAKRLALPTRVELADRWN